MLIYGAGKLAVRPLVLTVAASSKIVFIALVLSQGRKVSVAAGRRRSGIGAIWVVVFALYLPAGREAGTVTAAAKIP